MAALVTTVGSAALAQPWGGRPAVPPTQGPDPPYAVTQRGTFWRTWSRTRHLTDPTTGATVEKLDTYQELGDGICYENPKQPGQFIDSQDIIELVPDGAAAVQGPLTAHFATQLNAVGSITLASRTSGQTFQSHPLGLYYRDLSSGKVALIAAVQDTTGVLVPPNIVVYPEALGPMTNGAGTLRASFVYVWAHNGFDQSLVLEQAPPSPDALAGFNPATTVLEVHTALDSWPSPREVRPVTLKRGVTSQLDLVDSMMFFADTWLPVGAAFSFGDADLPAPGQPAQVRPANPSDTNKVLVAKSIVTMGGQAILVESVNYADVVQRLNSLPKVGGRADRGKSGTEGGRERKYAAATGPQTSRSGEFTIAGAGALPRGFALDYDLSGVMSSYTFSGTSFIPSSFTVGTATFLNGSVLKYAQNAYLTVTGPASFPSSRTGGPCLFTSMNDDGAGEIIQGSSSRPTASGGAGAELIFSNDTTGSIVRYAFFRFAQQGLCYLFTSSGGPNHYVQNTSFKDCTAGLSASLTSGTVYLYGSVCYSDVSVPVSGNSVFGSMSQVTQTDVYFNAARNSSTGTEDGSSGNPYPAGQSQSGTYLLDVYLNQALNNTLANRWIPGCTALTIHLAGGSTANGWSITNYVTDGIRLPAWPGAYFARGLSVLGHCTNDTILQLANQSSPPAYWADKHVFQSEYPDYYNGHFFFAPFTMSDMTIDCNWANQNTAVNMPNGPNISDDNNPNNRYKDGAIFMAAQSVTIQNLTVTNSGAKGVDIAGPSDPGAEAFPIWAATANVGQASPPITIQNCEVTGFTSVHGGYASCIAVNTHWTQTWVPGDTTAWGSTAAQVQNNWITNAWHTIALGLPTYGNAVQADRANFVSNYCDGIGLGFNSDCGGANNFTISNNTFTNCYQGINMGGPWGCGNYGWSSINISGNKFTFLGQPSGTNYYTFYNTNTAGPNPPPNCTWDGNNTIPAQTNSLYRTNLWFDCYAIRLAGACGANISITGNQCTTVPGALWQQPPGGAYQYYVVQVLDETFLAPGLGWYWGRDNVSPSCSGNTAALYAYSYAPDYAADDPRQWDRIGGPAGLAGYWRLNAPSGPTASDESGNGNTGTLQGGASWTTGYYSGAVRLDGASGYVQVGARSSLVMTTALTLSAWVYPTGSGGIIVNKEGEYEVALSNGTVLWALANTYPGWNWVDTGYSPTPNQWTHVALVYDSGTGVARTYGNGALVHTCSASGAIGDVDTADNDFRIGGRQVVGGNPYFGGRIDDVRLYNRALSGDEITAVKNGAGSGSGAILVGYWKFDEVNTNITMASDASGSGGTANLQGGANWTTAGYYGGAVSLDGVSGYVQVGARPNLVMTTALTLSAWVYPTGSGGIIVNKEGEYEVALNNGIMQWALANTNSGWSWVNTGCSPALNQWTHVALVYDSSAQVACTYANGVLVHTISGSGPIQDIDTTRNDFRIGGRQVVGGNPFFAGRIDDVRVYNRALSADDITAVMNGVQGGN